MHRKTTKETAPLAFYMDHIFGTCKIHQEQFIFQCDNFFRYIVWTRFKLMISKIKIGMTIIFSLREEYEIDKRVRLKSDKIEKILTWAVL